MKRRRWSLILLLILAGPAVGWAAEKSAPPGPESGFDREAFVASAGTEKILRLGLVDCLAYALKNNSEIKIKRIEPRLRQDDVRIARAQFEPSLTIDYSLSDSKEESASTLYPGVLESRDTALTAGVSGKLPLGTRYELDLLNEKYRSNLSTQNPNPYYMTEPAIVLTQPLFRSAGILVNRAEIVIARNRQRISEAGFRDTAADVITRVKAAYYNYHYYSENHSLARSSVARARELLETNQARYEKGLVSSVDLLETETAVAQREKALISAEANLRKAEDELKLITGLVDDSGVWNARLELIDRPGFTACPSNLVKSLENAFAFRDDYRAAKTDLRNREIEIKLAKNGLLPTLDLTGSFGLNGLGEDYQAALDRIDPDYRDWNVGVKLTLPWGSGDRAKYDRTKLEKAQALLEFKRLEQNIVLEVRNRAREVEIQARQVEAARLAREKETQNYAAQKERYAAGQVSTHDILDYQDRLVQAELDYSQALIAYNLALVNLDKSEGLTLARNNIKLEE